MCCSLARSRALTLGSSSRGCRRRRGELVPHPVNKPSSLSHCLSGHEHDSSNTSLLLNRTRRPSLTWLRIYRWGCQLAPARLSMDVFNIGDNLLTCQVVVVRTVHCRPIWIEDRWHELSNQYFNCLVCCPPPTSLNISHVRGGINRWLRGFQGRGARMDSLWLNGERYLSLPSGVRWSEAMAYLCFRSLMTRKATSWTFSVFPDIMRAIWRRWSFPMDSSWTGKPTNQSTAAPAPTPHAVNTPIFLSSHLTHWVQGCFQFTLCDTHSALCCICLSNHWSPHSRAFQYIEMDF